MNLEQVAILEQGVEVWNKWREENSDIRIDLSNACLSNTVLIGADLKGANFSRAIFDNADLTKADLAGSNLEYAYFDRAILKNVNLITANLEYARLYRCNLTNAKLLRAKLEMARLNESDLTRTNLSSASLKNTGLSEVNLKEANLEDVDFIRTYFDRTNFDGAQLGFTTFINVDLSTASCLNTVKHRGPSAIGIDTIYRSEGCIPEGFLRGAGVPESFLEVMNALFQQPIQYYTCFICYSSKDQIFAERLRDDLQARGVRCWCASHDMKTGDFIRPRIDEAIRLYDKVILILSKNSIKSGWVEFEVEAAIEKEQREKALVLFPIRIDRFVMDCEASWANHIRRTRHMGDFERWKIYDKYHKSFLILLRHLKSKQNII